MVKDPKKRSEIVDEYDQLKIFWLKKPNSSSYEKNEKGALVLKENNGISSPFDLSSRAFSDENLSYFRTFNAFYMPSIQYGKKKMDSQVNMMPLFLNLIDKNPYTFFTVLAHEVGHKMSPKVIRANGYDLTLDYKQLFQCYKDKKSIRLQENQQDEVMADYISSEILARQIQKIPFENRQQAVITAMQAYCAFDIGQDHSVSCKGEHPHPSLRISGVFGANPSLRKIMGCSGDSPRYQSCGMKKSILEIAESPTESSGGSSESQVKRGVK